MTREVGLLAYRFDQCDVYKFMLHAVALTADDTPAVQFSSHD